MVSVIEKFILRKCLIDNELGTNMVRFTNTFRIKDELWSIGNTENELWMELGTNIQKDAGNIGLN